MADSQWPRFSSPWRRDQKSNAIVDSYPGRKNLKYLATDNKSMSDIEGARNNTPPIIRGIDRGIGTRNFCIAGLATAWSFGLASVVLAGVIMVQGPGQLPSFLVGRAVYIGSHYYSWAPPPPDLPPEVDREMVYLVDHRGFPAPQAAVLVVPFVLHATIALVLGSLQSIRASSLRWALWREGRLRHNSNLYLFSAAGGWLTPTSWLANVVSGVGLALTYGGTTVLTFAIKVTAKVWVENNRLELDTSFDGSRYGLDFGAWGLLGFGVGFLIQASVATWCVVRQNDVPSWNTHPIANAHAYWYLKNGGEEITPQVAASSGYSPSRPVLSTSRPIATQCAPPIPSRPQYSAVSFRPYRVGEKVSSQTEYLAFHLPFTRVESIVCSKPVSRQPSASERIPYTRKLVRAIWVSVATVSLWTMVIGVVASVRNTTSGEFVKQDGEGDDFLSYWQTYGLVKVRYKSLNPYTSRRDWIGLVLQCIFISFILVPLHVVELLMELQRDESIWRKAATVGTRPSSLLLLENAKRWICWVMFVFKFIIPWMFGYAFTCSSEMFMRLLPLLVLTVLFFSLALFAEYLVRLRPRGYQPATYGDLPALVALVDDWSHTHMFWGDKGQCTKDIRLAGVSGKRLADLFPDRLYVGLSSDIPYGQRV